MRASIHRRPALWLGALGTALVGLLLGHALASAHAYIVRTSPGMGAILARPPTTVRLWFDEPVTLAVRNPLVVRDARGRQVDRGDAAIDPEDATEVVCHLQRLPPGVYTVSWRVISADTHVVHGAFTFRVGQGAAPPASASAEASGAGAFDSSAPLPSLLRWISLLGAITGVGGLLFPRLTVPSHGRDMAARGAAAWDILGRRARATALTGLAVLLLVAGPALLVQAADAADVALRTAVDPTILGATLVHSRWGLAWLVRVGLAMLLVAAVGTGVRTARHGATLLVAVLLLLTFSVAGHAAGYSNPVQEGVAIGCDWVHLVGAAAWLGGLAVLAAGLRPALRAVASDERRPFLGALIPRFSRIAVVSVLALLATGIYVTWLRLPDWGAFVATVYGQTLLVKLLLSLPLLALGGVNFWMGRGERGDLLSRTLGGLLARVGGWPAHVGTLIRGEAVLAALVLASVGVLTGQPPPQRATVSGPRPSRDGVVTLAGDIALRLDLGPRRGYAWELTARLVGATGRPLAGVRAVRVQPAMQGMPMAIHALLLRPAGPGTYRGILPPYGMAGQWLLTVEAQRRGAPTLRATFCFDLNAGRRC